MAKDDKNTREIIEKINILYTKSDIVCTVNLI